MAITLLVVDEETDSNEFERTLSTFQNVLMIERGLGFQYSHVVVSLHEDFSSYAEFYRRLKQNDSWTVTDSASFLVDLNEDSGFLSFSALAKDLMKSEKKQKSLISTASKGKLRL